MENSKRDCREVSVKLELFGAMIDHAINTQWIKDEKSRIFLDVIRVELEACADCLDDVCQSIAGTGNVV